MRGAFDNLIHDIGLELDRRTARRNFAAIGRDIEAGGARARRRGAELVKSLSALVTGSQIQLQEQRIRDRQLHRQRCVEKFEFAKVEFQKAIASGELFGAEISKYELHLQRIGEGISKL